jgi:hypothetical protein
MMEEEFNCHSPASEVGLNWSPTFKENGSYQGAFHPAKNETGSDARSLAGMVNYRLKMAKSLELANLQQKEANHPTAVRHYGEAMLSLGIQTTIEVVLEYLNAKRLA